VIQSILGALVDLRIWGLLGIGLLMAVAAMLIPGGWRVSSIGLVGCGLLYLPYLCGVMNPYWDIDARATFTGLSPSHTSAHMYRAILEGIAFELLLTLGIVEKQFQKRFMTLLFSAGEPPVISGAVLSPVLPEKYMPSE
jgi:hypothetical protein